MSDKKRSTYTPGNDLTFPQWAVEDKLNHYHWLNASKLAAATDGYEVRGFAVAKDKNGNPVRRDDLILGVMPMDKYKEYKAYQDQERESQMNLFMEGQAAEEDKIAHGFKKIGGKTNFKFEVN